MLTTIAACGLLVLGGVTVFTMAVWLLSRAERYDVADEIRERNRAIAGRPDDLAGLGVFDDGGWDD